MKAIGILVVLAFLSLSSAHAGDVREAPPAKPNPQARYLFYMHGLWLENNPDGKPHRRYGAYAYDEILQALADRGFIVMSELRPRGVRQGDYARKIAGQVRALLNAGVPAGHITVSGFSKGGAMTLLVASVLANPEINFVVLAGCGAGAFARSYERFLSNDAAAMKGHFLSLYDQDDNAAGTCRQAFDAAGLHEAKEAVLTIGDGHGVFYRPRPEWVDPLSTWANWN